MHLILTSILTQQFFRDYMEIRYSIKNFRQDKVVIQGVTN